MEENMNFMSREETWAKIEECVDYTKSRSQKAWMFTKLSFIPMAGLVFAIVALLLVRNTRKWYKLGNSLGEGYFLDMSEECVDAIKRVKLCAVIASITFTLQFLIYVVGTIMTAFA